MDTNQDAKDPQPGADIHFEMLWDCPSCGAKDLLGVTHRHCPACGTAQDPASRRFPPEGSEKVVNGHVYVGRDKTCGFCQTPASAAAKHCPGCGAPLDDARSVRISGEAPVAPLRARLSPTPVEKPSGRNIGAILAASAAGAAALAAIVWFAVMWNTTTQQTATVESASWTRSVSIESLRVVRDQDWCDSMPSDAREISSFRKVRSQRQVPDGQSCTVEKVDKGDGSFTKEKHCKTRYRSVDVMGDMCSYSVLRWRPSRTVTSSSSASKTPFWPEFSLAAPRAAAMLLAGVPLGAERESSRSESLSVSLSIPGAKDTETCRPSRGVWDTLSAGQQIPVTVRAIGGIDCSSVGAPAPQARGD